MPLLVDISNIYNTQNINDTEDTEISEPASSRQRVTTNLIANIMKEYINSQQEEDIQLAIFNSLQNNNIQN